MILNRRYLFFLSPILLSVFLFSQSTNAEKSKNYSFCFVGDTGHVNDIQALVAKSIAKSDCNIIWHTGDIVYPSGIDSEEDPRFKTNFLDPFKAIFEKEVPFFLTLGNHDYKKDPEAYLKIAKNNSLINYPNNYYFKSFENICFFALDTTIFDKLYLFYKRREQTEWIKKTKQKNKDKCQFSIAVAHHPLFSSGDRDKASPQLSIFLKSQVFGSFDLYVSGHNHVLADEGEKEGTVQLISGSGSLPGGSPEKLPEGKFNIESPGFLILVVKKERNELLGEYTFVDSNNNEVIWEKMKIGQGIRIE